MIEPHSILVRGGTVVDPTAGTAQPGDVAIAGEAIVAVGHAPDGFRPDLVIDAGGCLVMPGLIDL